MLPFHFQTKQAKSKKKQQSINVSKEKNIYDDFLAEADVGFEPLDEDDFM